MHHWEASCSWSKLISDEQLSKLKIRSRSALCIFYAPWTHGLPRACFSHRRLEVHKFKCKRIVPASTRVTSSNISLTRASCKAESKNQEAGTCSPPLTEEVPSYMAKASGARADLTTVAQSSVYHRDSYRGMTCLTLILTESSSCWTPTEGRSEDKPRVVMAVQVGVMAGHMTRNACIPVIVWNYSMSFVKEKLHWTNQIGKGDFIQDSCNRG